jgi:hypothetical protein
VFTPVVFRGSAAATVVPRHSQQASTAISTSPRLPALVLLLVPEHHGVQSNRFGVSLGLCERFRHLGSTYYSNSTFATTMLNSCEKNVEVTDLRQLEQAILEYRPGFVQSVQALRLKPYGMANPAACKGTMNLPSLPLQLTDPRAVDAEQLIFTLPMCAQLTSLDITGRHSAMLRLLTSAQSAASPLRIPRSFVQYYRIAEASRP